MTTRSQKMAEDIAALLRARNPLIWIITREEARVEGYIIEAAAAAGYIPRTWDVDMGVCDIGGKPTQMGDKDPGVTLNLIRERANYVPRPVGDRPDPRAERCVWIMRDLSPWVSGQIGIATCRTIRNLARLLPSVRREVAQAIVVISPSAEIPPELKGHATVVEWPMPDREEIASILDAAIDVLPEDVKATAAPNGARDAAIDAAVGLSGEEAQACYARSLVQLRRIDPAVIAREKKRVIATSGVLEWIDPLPGGLDAVGGLDQLKGWLVQRKLAYSPEARAYGLPAPKGAMVVGVQGCGKSMTAKAVGAAWGVPVVKLDLGAAKGKFVGESERKLRDALATIEAIGRCVLWMDEIEKSLAGATQGAADGGVSADALGTVLTWMQDRTCEAFVFATSNDVSQLPPELLRKGRFDELWFVDLPTSEERREIAMSALRQSGREAVAIDLDRVSSATDGFIGAEIAALVPEALFVAFADGAREITTDDLVAAAKTVTPLSKTAEDKITRLRDWSAGRARRATTEETEARQRQDRRQIDL